MNIVDLTEEELSTRRLLPQPISFRSATQIVWITECVDVWVYELEIWIVATLTDIKGCPCVLSLGKLVNESGFDWLWRHGQIPYLLKGDAVFYCYTHNEVPFICTLMKQDRELKDDATIARDCLLYTSPSPRDQRGSRMPSSA